MNTPVPPDQLRSLIPLNTLSPRQLEQLRGQSGPRLLLPGETLFDSAAGDAGITCFLLSGTLLMQGAEGGSCLMTAGSPESCRGFSPGARVSRAEAIQPSTVLVVDSIELELLVSRNQAHADLLLELALAGELTDWLEVLLGNPLFARVPVENVRYMLGRLEPLQLHAGHVLLREGEVGDCCYFLKQGRVEVMVGMGSDRQVVAELEEGACFGEEALLSDRPRNATLTVIEDACVLRLARQDFIALLKAPVVAELSLANALELIAEGGQWLDVRLLDDYQHGHAPQALSMPLHLLRLKARLLRRERVYLCYCDSGKRSANAAFVMAQLGFSVHALRGGLDDLTADEYAALLCERGSGYLARSDGRTERSG